MTPRMIRKPAEIDVPTMPPTLLKAPNLELMAEAVAATTTDVSITILIARGCLAFQVFYLAFVTSILSGNEARMNVECPNEK